jgi:uncharacterized membrane protein
LLLLFLIWNAGIYLAWLVEYFPSLIYLFPLAEHSYSIVCHQNGLKLIGEGTNHSLVCSRCAGIYFGLLTSSFVNLIFRIEIAPNNKVLFAVALPMLIDVILYNFGFYNYSKTIAFLTGLLLGSVGFLYLYSPLRTLFSNKNG